MINFTPEAQGLAWGLRGHHSRCPLPTAPGPPGPPPALPRSPGHHPPGTRLGTKAGTEDAVDGLSPRLLPPLGITERHVSEPQAAASTSQDQGGGRGAAGHRQRQMGRKRRHQRRSHVGPSAASLGEGRPSAAVTSTPPAPGSLNSFRAGLLGARKQGAWGTRQNRGSLWS